MRELKRKLYCEKCGKTWDETVILDDDEPDDFFDKTICDECEEMLLNKS